ncbi:MAG: DNA-processing protein DprA [Coriobacteriia bacterium]|nr:DNA-processing protein DprA [Coriobacteriia bacterium]
MSTKRWEIHLHDSDYPELLRLSPDPPHTLYGCGDPSALGPSLAVIGARKATPYGLTCASRFAGWAATNGIPIVSGGAIGCDMAAHEAAIDAGGTTIAVLGCGADIDYPRRAASLLDTLRSRHAVISEMPWGAPPQRWAFSRRNRIIAGLSLAVLVVEAGLPSGTFGTADHALAAGRDVWAVPGSILAPECRGANRLIRQGCAPVTCEAELRDELVSVGFTLGELPADGREAPSEQADPILAALRADPMRPDDLAFHLKRDIISIACDLTRFELRGSIVRLRDGRYSVSRQT